MGTQKQSRVDQLEKKIEVLKKAVLNLMEENQHLSTLNIGIIKTIELMPGYAEAIVELKNKMDPKYAEEKAVEELANFVDKSLANE
jgi:regulator of replication initiation timing